MCQRIEGMSKNQNQRSHTLKAIKTFYSPFKIWNPRANVLELEIKTFFIYYFIIIYQHLHFQSLQHIFSKYIDNELIVEFEFVTYESTVYLSLCTQL